MAKSRRGDDDFIDDPPLAEKRAAEPAAPDAEKEALLARVRALEAELASRRVAEEALTATSRELEMAGKESREARERVRELEGLLESATAPSAKTGADYWRVSLEGGPTHVVRAPDSANAWEVYKREMGVISSEHVAEASPATREEWRAAQAKRHGKSLAEWPE